VRQLTTTRSAGLLLVYTAIAAATILGQETKTERGTLTIKLTDTFGSKVSRGILSIKSSGGGVAYSAEAQGQVAVQLPYGRYTVEFGTNWYQPSRRDVVIDSPDSFAELAAIFVVPEENYAPGSISIKIDPAKSCSAEGSLWAKLIGVYTQDIMERHVSSGGYALFEPVDRGAYIVIVVDGSNVRATSPIMTKGQITTASIALAACESR
jgi:hypothetical protein